MEFDTEDQVLFFLQLLSSFVSKILTSFVSQILTSFVSQILRYCQVKSGIIRVTDCWLRLFWRTER